jgi:hypothetical protein
MAGGAVSATGGGPISGGAGGTGGSGSVLRDGGTGDREAGLSKLGVFACPGGPIPADAVAIYADALAATPTYLYWLENDQALKRKSKATGAIEKLADTGARGRHISVDDTRVFWDEAQSVFTMPLDGSAAPTRLASSVSAWTLGVDRVFYFKAGSLGPGSEIDAVPKGGGIPTVIATDVFPGVVAADATGVYWYNDRGADAGGPGFLKFTFASSAAGDFEYSNQMRYLLADGSHVLWANETTYLGPADILWSPPEGNMVTTVATAQLAVLGLVADATTAYWITSTLVGATGPGDLTAAPLAGSGPVRKLLCNVNIPLALAVDDDTAYIASGLGIVLQVSKN